MQQQFGTGCRLLVLTFPKPAKIHPDTQYSLRKTPDIGSGVEEQVSEWIRVKQKSKSWLIRFEGRQQLERVSYFFTLWSDQADQETLQKLTEKFCTRSPSGPALLWLTTQGSARPAEPSQGLFWEHRAAPWGFKGGGWAEKKQNSSQLRFKKRRSCAEGEGSRAAGASSLSAQENAGQETSPGAPSPTVKPRPGRGAPRTRVYWIAPWPAQGLPETPASGGPKKAVSQWAGEKAPRARLRLLQPEPWDPGPRSRTSFKRPHRPPQRGNPDGPARMRTGCSRVTGNCSECRKVKPERWQAWAPVQCNPLHTPQSPARGAQPSKTPTVEAPDNRGRLGGGRRRERRGKRGRNRFGEKAGFEYFIVIIFHLLVHQLKS